MWLTLSVALRGVRVSEAAINHMVPRNFDRLQHFIAHYAGIKNCVAILVKRQPDSRSLQVPTSSIFVVWSSTSWRCSTFDVNQLISDPCRKRTPYGRTHFLTNKRTNDQVPAYEAISCRTRRRSSKQKVSKGNSRLTTNERSAFWRQELKSACERHLIKFIIIFIATVIVVVVVSVSSNGLTYVVRARSLPQLPPSPVSLPMLLP
jgi:hypothetical protein